MLYLVISSQLSKLLGTFLRHQTGWTWQKSKNGKALSGKSKRIGTTEDQACGHEGLRQKRMVITAVRLSIALIVAGGGNITVLAGKWQESMSMSASEAIGLTYSCTARVLQGQGTNCTPTCTITANEVHAVQTGIALQDSSLAAREETAQACTVNTPRRFLRALQIA